MTVDGAVVPGSLLLAAEFIALATVGYVVARVALRQRDDRAALALRLRQHWWEAAFIPAVRLTIAEDGAVTYVVYEEALSLTPIP